MDVIGVSVDSVTTVVVNNRATKSVVSGASALSKEGTTIATGGNVVCEVAIFEELLEIKDEHYTSRKGQQIKKREKIQEHCQHYQDHFRR